MLLGYYYAEELEYSKVMETVSREIMPAINI
jgi:hypothetical protein